MRSSRAKGVFANCALIFMSPDVLAIDRRPKVRVKAVALPVEHGSWGFLFEPLVAGIAVAPSVASPWIAVMVIGVFLMRQPLKVILTDWQNGRWLPQTKVATRFLLFYSAVFGVGLTASISLATPESFIPFAMVIPFRGLSGILRRNPQFPAAIR